MRVWPVGFRPSYAQDIGRGLKTMVLVTGFESARGNFRPVRGFGRELGWFAGDTQLTPGEFCGVPVKVCGASGG